MLSHTFDNFLLVQSDYHTSFYVFTCIESTMGIVVEQELTRCFSHDLYFSLLFPLYFLSPLYFHTWLRSGIVDVGCFFLFSTNWFPLKNYLCFGLSFLLFYDYLLLLKKFKAQWQENGVQFWLRVQQFKLSNFKTWI